MSRKIFGSNLRLADRRARHIAADGTPVPLEKHWTALRAARQNVGKIEKSFLMAERLGLVPDPRVRTHATPNVTRIIEHMGLVPRKGNMGV